MGLRRDLNRTWVQLHMKTGGGHIIFDGKDYGTFQSNNENFVCLYTEKSEVVNGFVIPTMYFVCKHSQLAMAFSNAIVFADTQDDEFYFAE